MQTKWWVAALLAVMVPAPALAGPTANYHCADGSAFTATFSPPGAAKGEVELAYPDGRKLTLPQGLSADGGRYEDGDTEFWIKGDGGTLTIAGKATNCEAKS